MALGCRGRGLRPAPGRAIWRQAGSPAGCCSVLASCVCSVLLFLRGSAGCRIRLTDLSAAAPALTNEPSLISDLRAAPVARRLCAWLAVAVPLRPRLRQDDAQCASRCCAQRGSVGAASDAPTPGQAVSPHSPVVCGRRGNRRGSRRAAALRELLAKESGRVQRAGAALSPPAASYKHHPATHSTSQRLLP